MILPRRSVLLLGGGLAALSLVPRARLQAAGVVEIEMRGREDGSHVWFDPIGLRIAPGTTLRWANRDPGNAHTATAYHPDIDARQRRVPLNAAPWDSGYLLPDESFAVTLRLEGIYDYYCLPHEHAGMVGRIVVGEPPSTEAAPGGDGEPPPEIAVDAFPAVSDIIEKGVVRPS